MTRVQDRVQIGSVVAFQRTQPHADAEIDHVDDRASMPRKMPLLGIARLQPAAAVGATPCYYCGLPASEIDHVVPRNVLETVASLDDATVKAYMVDRHRVKTVDACRECNGLIGGLYFDTLEQRKAFLKDRLRARYRKYLATPEWTDSELAGLSDRLRNYVLNGLELRRLTLARLAW